MVTECEELRDLLDRLESLRHVIDYIEREDRLLAELLLARKSRLLRGCRA